MPKINVYLPNDLAAAVRSAGFPVSPVCQRALADAVSSAARARSVVAALRDPELSSDRVVAAGRDASQALTQRLMSILEAAIGAARERRPAGTGQLLTGLLDEGANLAVRVLQALDVGLDELRETVAEVEAEAGSAEAAAPAHGSLAAGLAGAEPSVVRDLTMQAREALAAAIESAVALGHNYVGSEHLLLGLRAGEGTVAARALHQHGVEAVEVRRALLAALAGYAHGRQAAGRIPPDSIDDLARRLEAVENRLAALGA